MAIGGKEVHRITTYTIYLPNKFTLLVQTLNKLLQHFRYKCNIFRKDGNVLEKLT